MFDTRLDRENSRNDEYKQHNSPQHYTPQPDYSTSPPASPSRNQYYDTGKQPQPPISSDVAFRVHPDYSSRQGSHNENPYDRSIDTMNTSTQQHHAHHIDSNTEQPTDIYSQNKDQIEQRYRQRKQQEEALREKDNRDNITRENRAKSGKYETEITPYMGSTYAISGDFTHIVEPQSPPLSPAAPQVDYKIFQIIYYISLYASFFVNESQSRMLFSIKSIETILQPYFNLVFHNNSILMIIILGCSPFTVLVCIPYPVREPSYIQVCAQ